MYSDGKSSPLITGENLQIIRPTVEPIIFFCETMMTEFENVFILYSYTCVEMYLVAHLGLTAWRITM